MLWLDVLLFEDAAAENVDDEGAEEPELEVEDKAAANSEVDVQLQTEVKTVIVVGLTVTKIVEAAACKVGPAAVMVTVKGQTSRLSCWPAGEARDDDNIEHTKKRVRMVNILKGCCEKNEWP